MGGLRDPDSSLAGPSWLDLFPRRSPRRPSPSLQASKQLAGSPGLRPLPCTRSFASPLSSQQQLLFPSVSAYARAPSRRSCPVGSTRAETVPAPTPQHTSANGSTRAAPHHPHPAPRTRSCPRARDTAVRCVGRARRVVRDTWPAVPEFLWGRTMHSPAVGTLDLVLLLHGSRLARPRKVAGYRSGAYVRAHAHHIVAQAPCASLCCQAGARRAARAREPARSWLVAAARACPRNSTEDERLVVGGWASWALWAWPKILGLLEGQGCRPGQGTLEVQQMQGWQGMRRAGRRQPCRKSPGRGRRVGRASTRRGRAEPGATARCRSYDRRVSAQEQREHRAQRQWDLGP